MTKGYLTTHTKPEDVKGNEFHIAFDMDSVLNNMGDNLGLYIAKHFDVPEPWVRRPCPEGYRKFHFDLPGVSSNTMYALVLKYLTEESPSELTTPYMVKVLEHVYSTTKVPICIVTARPSSVCSETRDWLEENLTVPFVCYMVDGHKDKALILEELECICFVDDRYRTVVELDDHIAWPVLYKRPWNQGRPHRPTLIEIRDLRDIIPVANLVALNNPMDWPLGVDYPPRNGDGGDVLIEY
jgi:hypothetical protein